MGVCGSKGVAVGKYGHDTADPAASLTGRPQSAGSAVAPSAGSQLRTAAKTAWQASARNLRATLSRSRRRQESYRARSDNTTDTTSDVKQEELDTAGIGGRPGDPNRRNVSSGTTALAGGNVAWQTTSELERQQGDARSRHPVDRIEADDSDPDDVDPSDSCVRSFHVRNITADSTEEAGEGDDDDVTVAVPPQRRKESTQPSAAEAQEGSLQLRKAAAGGGAAAVAAPPHASLPLPDVTVTSDEWLVGGRSCVPRSTRPEGGGGGAGPLTATSPPTTGACTGPSPPAAAAATAAALPTPPAPASAPAVKVTSPPPTPPPAQPAAARAAAAAQAAEASAVAAAVEPPRAGDFAPPAVPEEAVQWVVRPGPPVESAYVMGEVLGKGSFGVVHAATHIASGSHVAVKTIRKSLLAAADVSALRREVEILHHLSGHPHISQLLGVYEEPGQLHLVLELYQGGDLFDAIIAVGRHSERAAADVMRTVLTAISYCHAMGVAHRDIKPENFMLTAPVNHPSAAAAAIAAGAGRSGGQQQPDGAGGTGGYELMGSKLKLIDFGLSVFCSDSQPLTDTVGTSYYVAPEVLARCYSRSADVWSAGVILHILLTGYAPFDGRNDQEILRAVQSGKLDLTTDPIWTSISRDATAVLNAMLHRDPAQRATADQLLAMPWLGRTAASCTASAAPLPGVVSDRMRRFARMNSFKKEARRVVAGLMRPEEVAGLVAQFKALDADGDGKLNVQELRDGLARQELQGTFRTAGGGGAAAGAVAAFREDELRELVDRSDLNGDGLLDQSEFLGAALPTAVIARRAQQATPADSAAAAAAGLARPGSRVSAAATAANAAGAGNTNSNASNPLAAAFTYFDADGSGFITPDELRSALAAHHPESKGPDIQALLSRVDRDADGRISYPEFVDMLVQEVDDDELDFYGSSDGPAAAADSKGRGKGPAARTAQGARAGSQPHNPHHAQGAGRGRGGGGAVAAAAAAAAARRRSQVTAAWGVGAPARATAAGRGRNGPCGGGGGGATSFRSTAAVPSGSGRLSSFDWCDECRSSLGETSGEAGDDGGWTRGDTADSAAASPPVYGNGDQLTARVGGCGGAYVPSRLSGQPAAVAAPGGAHAGLYRAAEAAALTLMGGGTAAESSLLGQMSMGLPGGNGAAAGTRTRVGAAPAYTANRPPQIAVPTAPAAARRARRHSAAEALEEGYGDYGGYGAAGAGGDGCGNVTNRAARQLRISEGQALNNYQYNHINHQFPLAHGPRQHAALHPGGVGGPGPGLSTLGGRHRSRPRQIGQHAPGMDEQMSPSQRIIATSAVQYGHDRGGGGGGGGGSSAPMEHLVSPAADVARSPNRCGFRQRQPPPLAPRALGPVAAVPYPPVDMYGNPGGGGGSIPIGTHPYNIRRSADAARYADKPLVLLSCGGGVGIRGGEARGDSLPDEAAVLPPGACLEECCPPGTPAMAAAAQHAGGRHRRSAAGAGASAHDNPQPAAFLVPGGMPAGNGQRGSGGGGGGSALSEPLPRIGGGAAAGGRAVRQLQQGAEGGGVCGRGPAAGAAAGGDGLVLKSLMPSWEEEDLTRTDRT